MDKLEQLRKKILNYYKIVLLVVWIIVVITQTSLMFVFIAAIIVTIKIKPMYLEYKKLFKNTIVLEALKEKFTEVDYRPNSGMKYQVISGTHMIDMGDKYHSEDFVSAKYKDIKFEQADVHIEEEYTYKTKNSEGETVLETGYTTIFDGRWMVFDFNKKFKSDVQIFQMRYLGEEKKSHINKRKEKNRKKNVERRHKNDEYKKVSMESESFNDKFDVYSKDEHEAFYIITPSLMNKIEDLADKNIGILNLCFINNRLHVAIDECTNSFEPNLFINTQKLIDKTAKEIEIITQFVDELNLDRNLFKEEV